MKKIHLLIVGVLMIILASCQTVAEKCLGNYTGTYSASGLIYSTGSGTLTLSPDGNSQVDMLFTSSDNPNVNISDVKVTDIFGQIIFDLNNDMGGTIQVSGTIANSNVLALTYDNSTDTVSLSLAGFGKL